MKKHGWSVMVENSVRPNNSTGTSDWNEDCASSTGCTKRDRLVRVGIHAKPLLSG